MQLILVTGMSGSGKSVVLNALEDSGYFCIDNLPVVFIEPIAESLQSRSFPRLAIAADTRMREDLRSIRVTLERLQSAGIEVRLLFLNARTDALVQRYSETRRRHPLSLRPEAIEALGLEGGKLLFLFSKREQEMQRSKGKGPVAPQTQMTEKKPRFDLFLRLWP